MVPDLTEHARFFDHLVELVPAKFYYDDETRTDARFLAKAAKEALKADIKFKAKLAKRDKLNPDKAVTTLDVQRRKSQEAHAGKGIDKADDHGPSTSGRQNDVAAGGDANVQAAASGLKFHLQGNQPSRDELRQRLQKKLEEARQRRKASAEAAKEWKTQTLQGNASSKEQQQQQRNGKQGQQQHAGTKRKGEAAAAAEQPHGGAGGKQAGGGKSPHGQTPQPAKKPRREELAAPASGSEAAEDFKFARIEVEEGGRQGGKGPGARRPPKQVLLKQAEAQKAEREALAGTQEGKAKAQQAAWKAALARAAGEKVLDDPKLLRRSLKRESKRKEKHSKAWQERVATQQDAQATRQAKRKDNLAARRQNKVDHMKAKREKKLLRPGFEGRKEGFITTGGGAAGGAK